MSNKPVKGLRVGNYRITPLGLIVLAVLLVLIIGAVVLVVFHPFNKGDESAVNVQPKPPPRRPSPRLRPNRSFARPRSVRWARSPCSRICCAQR